MLVILNSDVIYSKDLRRTGLPKHVVDFLEKCVAAQHELIIPETTKIEFEKEQEKARTLRIAEIEKAAELLRQCGIEVSAFAAIEIISSSNLNELLDQIEGLNYSVVQATLEDYQIALRKACLREPPHPPEGKSDEMRDLVIWQTAARIARATGGAILISRDEVHTHFRGDAEAASHQLSRATDFDQALEILQIETTSGALVKSYLETRWNEIIASDLPFVFGANIRSITDVHFIDDEYGCTRISSNAAIATGNGEILTCILRLKVQNGTLLSVSIKAGLSEFFEITFEPESVVLSEFAEAVKSLNGVLES